MLNSEIEMSSSSEKCYYLTSFQGNEKNEEEITTLNYRQCCKTCCKLLLSLGGFSYYVLSIRTLTITSYQREREICPMSELWTYLIFSLISNIGLIKVNHRDIYLDIYYLLLPNLIILIIKIVFVIWLSLQITYSTCLSQLKDTYLYYMSLTQYGLDIAIVLYLSSLSLYLKKTHGIQQKRHQQDAIQDIKDSFDDINDEEKELMTSN